MINNVNRRNKWRMDLGLPTRNCGIGLQSLDEGLELNVEFLKDSQKRGV